VSPGYEPFVSNFPLAYKLSWLPRLVRPTLEGDRRGLLPAEGTPLSPQGKTRRLVFLGDISAVANRAAPEIDASLSSLIASADLVIGNCEAPVVEQPRHPLGTAIGTRHAMTPGFLAETLAAAAIAPSKFVLSLANNHMLDQGTEGYAETRAALAKLGIVTIGGMEDGPVRTIALDGLTIALAAFTQWRNAGREAFAGRVTMLDGFLSNGLPALRSARADLVCVVPHWDREFRHFPSGDTRKLARTLVEGGAGLVVGHHAHVLQPAERIGETLIAYGLGDFLSTALPRQPWPTRLGAILVVCLSTDPASRGRLAAWRVAPFFRMRHSGRERLVALDAATGRVGDKARKRFAAIFPSTAECA
jgi:poly-gamma-glutamate capsule biosynthesis protein CapA/YwtB (metallophosphatase superfamily)